MSGDKEAARQMLLSGLDLTQQNSFATALVTIHAAALMDPCLEIECIKAFHVARILYLSESCIAPDYYKILQAEKISDEQQIAKAFRKQALLLHPDKNRFPGADRAFDTLQKVYAIISDRELRQSYDAQHVPDSTDFTEWKSSRPDRSDTLTKTHKSQSTTKSTLTRQDPFDDSDIFRVSTEPRHNSPHMKGINHVKEGNPRHKNGSCESKTTQNHLQQLYAEQRSSSDQTTRKSTDDKTPQDNCIPLQTNGNSSMSHGRSAHIEDLSSESEYYSFEECQNEPTQEKQFPHNPFHERDIDSTPRNQAQNDDWHQNDWSRPILQEKRTKRKFNDDIQYPPVLHDPREIICVITDDSDSDIPLSSANTQATTSIDLTCDVDDELYPEHDKHSHSTHRHTDSNRTLKRPLNVSSCQDSRRREFVSEYEGREAHHNKGFTYQRSSRFKRHPRKRRSHRPRRDDLDDDESGNESDIPEASFKYFAMNSKTVHQQRDSFACSREVFIHMETI
eukprot:TRINITY_DN12142_c0_g1_i1.p1 TRINITY_DN12142_c0_g1~~TRINITY_DN12142_c0_g1_i1.p1  ORF type:complete len:506 (+),score=104.10 TRINITY_DN12142_c0_g1_i1:49-1566(+)